MGLVNDVHGHHEKSPNMVQYRCDGCKRSLNSSRDVRYVVKIDVHAALDPTCIANDVEDRDHLAEIDDQLERAWETDDPSTDDGSFKRQFDLCSACYGKFRRNPLGVQPPAQVGFSAN